MTAIEAADAAYMERALELAARGLYTTDPNPRVGCVLVRHGRVIGEGWHQRAGEAHAEVLALRAAGGDARGATAYVTLEPCSHTGRTPPCADALLVAGIERVVCSTSDPNPAVSGAGIGRLRNAGVEVLVGPGSVAARALNVGFLSRFERGRPFVRLKMAMSLDARTAPAGGGQSWITGEGARADVQTWRARSTAIMTGAGTVRVDDPRLDVRLTYGPWIRQPLRVLLDPLLSCEPAARFFDHGGALVFGAQDASGSEVDAALRGYAARGTPVVRLPRAGRGLDLRAALDHLTGLQVNELLVESGPRLAGAFLESGLVDELILYVAPRLLGSDAAPLADLPGVGTGGLLQRYEFHDQRLIQDDLRLVLTPRKV
jgi:diaminohydroxyphosphoribosylaminopyrimidine deaminase/5-amino-6-(5-phosphoribosylamino)uracil reductase